MSDYVAGLIVAASLLMISDGLPRLRVEQHCRAVAERAAPLAVFDSCMRREQEAHETLIKKWGEFDPADRSHCTRLTTLAGAEWTYTSLLTCLEIEEHLRKLRRGNQRGRIEPRGL
jgi:hypothetical protein